MKLLRVVGPSTSCTVLLYCAVQSQDNYKVSAGSGNHTLTPRSAPQPKNKNSNTH